MHLVENNLIIIIKIEGAEKVVSKSLLLHLQVKVETHSVDH